MGILGAIKADWKARSTAGKIGLIIDAICGFGSMAMGQKIGDKLSEDSTRFERFCIKTATTGACMFAGEQGSAWLKENGGNFAGMVIDKARGKDVKITAEPTDKGAAFVAREYGEETGDE